MVLMREFLLVYPTSCNIRKDLTAEGTEKAQRMRREKKSPP
jgi:hypothetical protein